MSERELILLEWENNQISSIIPVLCAKKLVVTLSAIFELYGKRNTTNETILDFAVKFIMKDFNFLAIEEIEEAFRLWAQNKFEGAEPYAGEFNLLTLNRILSDYCKYRKTDRRNLFDKIKIEKLELEKEKSKEMERTKFEENTIEIIQEQLRKVKTYDKVPVWIYAKATEMGLIQLNATEYTRIISEARIEAVKEVQSEMNNCINRNDRIDLKNRLVDQDYMEGRAKIIARKIAVWENREKLLKI